MTESVDETIKVKTKKIIAKSSVEQSSENDSENNTEVGLADEVKAGEFKLDDKTKEMLTIALLQEMAKTLDLPLSRVNSVVELLIHEQCTIPFVARYRKERTGNMDEVQLQAIVDTHEQLWDREKRRYSILNTLEKDQKLTPELKTSLLQAKTLAQLEDIYAPYKTKKITKGQKARDAGLTDLLTFIFSKGLSFSLLEAQEKEALENFIAPDKGFASIKECLQGAMDILSEQLTHTLNSKND